MSNCIVYIACRMSNRDKSEQVQRANYVSAILRQYGITPISPVLIEKVPNEKGLLFNDSKQRLRHFWERDKQIIRNIAHVVLIDGADEKSFGVEREMAYARWCLWKPCILLMPKQLGYNIADLEDDAVVNDIRDAAVIIRDNYLTSWQRRKWRMKMLIRSLPKWVLGQLYAFR